jgi:DNA-binding CsgD family transcriptional regulator/tetratricopeptide (TPR) repeat protein
VSSNAPDQAAPSSTVPRRAVSPIVGRLVELGAVQAALARAHGGIFAVSLEGEPGIGKTRILQAAADTAAAEGFVSVRVTADEEIRGPFLLARGILASATLTEGSGTAVLQSIEQARETLTGRDPGLDGLPPDQRMVRVLDQATMAICAIAHERPTALLLDDVQWSDTDSLRVLRYLVRTEPGLPVLIVLAMRAEEAAAASELVNLIADLERLGLVRRVVVARFRQSETAELVRLTLGGSVDPASAAALHAQAEGVPFVVQELVRSYRESGLLQRIGDGWKLNPRAGRLLPSAVRTLVQRRAAHLDDGVKVALSEAAVFGRSFRLADLCAVRSRLGDAATNPASLSEWFAPAVTAGLLHEVHDASGADYRFGHEQVREFCLGLLSASRRRAIHLAIVEIMTADGEPPVAALPILARHALAAGDAERSARLSVEAVRAALAANAPEEALRLVEESLPVIATRTERVALLRARDDALAMLSRPADRLEGLAELAALAEAAGELGFELEIMLRRAAALRLSEQHDRAGELSSAVRRRAAEHGDRVNELAACLELGQDRLHMAIGEGYTPSPVEADLDGAAEAYERAIALAEELRDDASLAAALRERGVISLARIRAWFIDWTRVGGHGQILDRVAHGESLDSMLPELPVMGDYMDSGRFLERALGLFEAQGDRRGAMSTIIALAYRHGAAEIHLGSNPTRAIEEIRRLSSTMRSLSKETERGAAEAQMLYGVHVFARTKVIPDLAVSRGKEAFERARDLGDRGLEFLAAGGTAMAHLDLGSTAAAEQWLERAADAAADSPTQSRARQLELWRGLLSGASGDAAQMRRHFETALELATAGGRPAVRCEVLATLAMEAARLGRAGSAPDLLDLAESSAEEVRRIGPELPGHAPWEAQADAASSVVASARGDAAKSLEFARSALDRRRVAMREDPHLEILIPAARAVVESGAEDERAAVRTELRLLRGLIAQRTLDEDSRVAWFRGPWGRELAELAGEDEPGSALPDVAPGQKLDRTEHELLRLLTDGRTNREIAATLGLSQAAVERALTEMYARLGVSSRSEATALALRGQVAQ